MGSHVHLLAGWTPVYFSPLIPYNTCAAIWKLVWIFHVADGMNWWGYFNQITEVMRLLANHHRLSDLQSVAHSKHFGWKHPITFMLVHGTEIITWHLLQFTLLIKLMPMLFATTPPSSSPTFSLCGHDTESQPWYHCKHPHWMCTRT